MEKRKLLHIILGFAILLQAAFFQVALPNLVLCVGEDGHLAFEWRSQNTSDYHKDSALPNLFKHNKTPESNSDEVNCKDINLHFHPSLAEKTQKQNISKTVSTVFDQFEIQSQQRISHPVSLKWMQPIQVNPTIGIAQSTILII